MDNRNYGTLDLGTHPSLGEHRWHNHLRIEPPVQLAGKINLMNGEHGMTKNQFLKKTGLKGCHRGEIKPYLDIVARYKGYLSYHRLYLLIYIAVMFGRCHPNDILGYVDAVMRKELHHD